jgi:hypothetical protein
MHETTTAEVILPRAPGNPSMVALAEREAMFQDWPAGLNHLDTQAMAKAGFFYTGK